MAPTSSKPRSQNPKQLFSFDIQSFGIDAKKAFEQCPKAPPPRYPPRKFRPPKMVLKNDEDDDIRMKLLTMYRKSPCYFPGRDGILDMDIPAKYIPDKLDNSDIDVVPLELFDDAKKLLSLHPMEKSTQKRKNMNGFIQLPKKRHKSDTDNDSSKDTSFDFTVLEQKEMENQELEIDDCDEEENTSTQDIVNDDDTVKDDEETPPLIDDEKKPGEDNEDDTTEPFTGSDIENENDPDDNDYYEDQDYDEDELIESTDYMTSYFDNGEDFEDFEDRVEMEVY